MSDTSIFPASRGFQPLPGSLTPSISNGVDVQPPVTMATPDVEDFFENGAIALHLVGPDGVILKANRAELELLGYRQDEYIGRHIAEFHRDKDVIEDILGRLARGEKLNKYPARLLAKDGSTPKKFQDQYEDAGKEMLKKKQHGEKIEVPKERKPANVVNLMEALRQSIAAESGTKGKPPVRSVQQRTGAKKKANKSSARQRKAS